MSDRALAGLLVIAPLFAITITKASNVRQRSLLVHYHPFIGPVRFGQWVLSCQRRNHRGLILQDVAVEKEREHVEYRSSPGTNCKDFEKPDFQWIDCF